MKTRLIDTDKDHPIASAWWPAHGWPGVARVILPKGGVVVESDDGKPLAMAWIYMDNSTGVAMMEWTVTNPKNTAKQSYLALTMLTQAAREFALEMQYSVLLTTAKQEALVRVYERNGFEKTDTGMTHLVMLTKKD